MGIGPRSDGDMTRNVFTWLVVRVWSQLSDSVGDAGSIEGFEREWYPERQNVPRLRPTSLSHYIPLPSVTPSH